MTLSTTMNKLESAGLIDFSSDVPSLTEKGSDYLRILDDAATQEITVAGRGKPDRFRSFDQRDLALNTLITRGVESLLTEGLSLFVAAHGPLELVTPPNPNFSDHFF